MVESVIGTPGGRYNQTGVNPLANVGSTYGGNATFSQADSFNADRNAMRWNLLRTTGMEGFSDEFSSIGLGLVQSNLSDDEIVERMVSAIEGQTVPKMMKFLEEMEDDMQESQFALWHPSTQDLLKTNGYKLPSEYNKRSWYNPFDLDDFAPAWLAASAPFQAVMAPFRHGLSPALRGTWEALNKSLNLGLRLQRTFSIEWERRLAETNGGLGGFLEATAGDMKGLTTNFRENWQNAEFERASFTVQARDSARSLLTDENDYNILLGTLRHEGNVVKAGVDYFTEVAASQGSVDPEGQGIQDFITWSDKDVTNDPNWMKAGDALSRGSVEAGGISARQYDRVIETAHLGFLDDVNIPGTQVSINDIGKTGSVFVGTLGSAVLFDPVSIFSVGYGMVIKGARVGVNLKNAGSAAIKLKSIEALASSVRAMNALKKIPKAKQTVKTAAELLNESRTLSGKSPTALLKSEGEIRGVFKAKNLVQEQAAYIKDFEPNFLGKMPFYIKRQANHIIKEVEYIVEHFHAHELFVKGEKLDALDLFKNIKPDVDPLSLLLTRKPHYASELGNMLRYHKNSKLTGMSVADLDLIPVATTKAIRKLPTEFQDSLLRVKTPGLDTWDGVWGFFQSQVGMSALMGSPIGRAGLAGRTHKFFMPRHTKWSQNRVRVRARMDRFFDNKAYRMEKVHPIAYASATNLFHMVRQSALSNKLYQTLQGTQKAKTAQGVQELITDRLKALTPTQIQEIIEATSSDVGRLQTVSRSKGISSAPDLDETIRVQKQYNLNSEEINLIRDLYVQDIDKLTEDITKTIKALNAGDVPSGVADDVIRLVEEQLPQLTEFFTVDQNMRGAPIRFKNGKPIFRKSAGFARAGKNYLRNKNGHINAPAGHVNSTNALPNAIEPLGDLTWKQIHHGKGRNLSLYDPTLSLNSRFSWAGYTTPNKLLDAINTKGVRKVVADLNAWSGPKIKLSKFQDWLKNNLGLIIKERRYYDKAGILKDTALGAAFTMAYHPMRLFDKLTKIAPKKGFIDVASPTAIKDFKALLEMGVKADMSRHTIDQYLSIFINGTPAQRWDVQSSFLMDFAGRTGLLLYGGKNAERWLQQFVRQGAHHYSNFGQDLVTSNLGRTRRAIIPGAEKEAQVSNLNIVPSWRELGEGARYMNMTHYLGYMPWGPAMVDKWFRRYWQPSVLLKFGIGLRNAADEGIQFLLREGPMAWVNAKLAKSSLNRAKVYGPWGELMTQPVSAETRRSLLLRPFIRGYRFLLDSLTIGDRGVSIAASKRAANAKGHTWGSMSADAVMADVTVARRHVQTKSIRGFANTIFGSNSRYLQNADGTLNKQWYDWIGILGMAEAFSNKFARFLHISPLPTKAKISEKALKLFRKDADLYRQRTLEMMQSPMVMDAVYEQLFGTYRAYYGKNHLTAIDEMLQLNARGIGTTRGLLPYVKLMDNARWDVVGSNTVQSTGLKRQDALGQSLIQYKNDPTMQTIARVLSHYVDDRIKMNSSDLVNDDLIYGIGRYTGLETHEIGRFKSDPLLQIKFAYKVLDEIPHARRLVTEFYKAVSDVPIYHPTEIIEFKALPRTVMKSDTATIEQVAMKIARYVKRNNIEMEFMARLLNRLDRTAGSALGKGNGGPDLIAFLLQSGKNIDEFTTNMDDVMKAMSKAGVDELAGTYHGQQSMEALTRTGGLDPTITRTLDNVLPDEIAVFFPYISGDTASLLTWAFQESTTPIGTQMLSKLEELLALRIGADEARQVGWLLNPMNRIWGSLEPVQWLGLHIERAGEIVNRATRAQTSASPQGFASELMALLGEPQLKDVAGIKVPLLAGSYSITDMRGVLQGLQDWRKWLDDVDLIPDQVGITDVVGGDLDGMLVRRKVSKAEFFAEPGFGKYYGSTSGHRFMRPDGTMGYDEDPLTVLLYGDEWGDTGTVPSGWHQATEDGVPIPGEWEPDPSNAFVKSTLNKREWLEAEIGNLARGLMTLPRGSRVRYAKPIGKSGSAAYDRFGKTVEKILTLLKDQTGATVRDLELAIWRTLGDFPYNKMGVEEAITTLLQKADDGTYYLNEVFDGTFKSFRTEEILRRAKQYPNELAGNKSAPLLYRELRGFDNETLAKSIVELEQRGDAANGILDLFPFEGFTSEILIKDLKRVLSMRPAGYKGYTPSVLHRLDDAWKTPTGIAVERIPDEVLLSYLLYGTGDHKSKQFIHNVLDIELKNRPQFIRTINEVAEELWLRGYEVFDETPRALWFRYAEQHAGDHHKLDQQAISIAMAKGDDVEISPYTRGVVSYIDPEDLTADKIAVRGFTGRGQTSLFDDGGEGVRYSGPRYEVRGEQVESLTPAQVRAEIESNLDATRSRMSDLQDDIDMHEFRVQQENEIKEAMEAEGLFSLEEPWGLDVEYLDSQRILIEALREDESILVGQLDDLVNKRPTYYEMLKKVKQKDTELLGVDKTIQLLDDTRIKLLGDKRGVLTQELADLRKQRKLAKVEDFKDARRPLIETELEWIDGEIGKLANLARKLADEGLIDDADDLIGLNFYIQNAKFNDPTDDIAVGFHLKEEAMSHWRDGNYGTDVLDEMAESYAYAIDPTEWNKFEEWFNANIAWLDRRRRRTNVEDFDVDPLVWYDDVEEMLRETGMRDLAEPTDGFSWTDAQEVVHTADELPEWLAPELIQEMRGVSHPTLLMDRRNHLLKRIETHMTGTEYKALGDEITKLEKRLTLEGTVPKRDFIGTIGGTKGDTGLRRIWPELSEDSIVPQLDLIPEPFAPVDEIFPNALRYDETSRADSPASELMADVNWEGGFLPQFFGETMPKGRKTGRGVRRLGTSSRRARREVYGMDVADDASPHSLARLGKNKAGEDSLVRPASYDPNKRRPNKRQKQPFKGGLNAWRFRNKFDPENIYSEGTWVSGHFQGTGTLARTEPTELMAAPHLPEIPFIDDLQVMAYRKSHAKGMILNDEIDVVLPFFRNSKRVDTAKHGDDSFIDDPKLRPAWANGFDVTARKAGIPVTWAVRGGQSSGADRIVKSRLHSAYPQHTQPRSLYTARVVNSGSERPEIYGFSAGDVGGFNETDKFVATNATDLLGNQIDVVGHVDEIKNTRTYMNKDGQVMVLREGQESLHPSFQDNGKILTVSDEVTKATGQTNPLSTFYEHDDGFFFRGHTFRTTQGAYEAFKTGKYRKGYTNKSGMQAKSKGLAMEHLPAGVSEVGAFALMGSKKSIAGQIGFSDNIKRNFKGPGFLIDAAIGNKHGVKITGFTVPWKAVQNLKEGDVIKLYAPRKKGSEAVAKEVWVEVTEKIQLKFADDLSPEEWAMAEGVDIGTATFHWKPKSSKKDQKRGIEPSKVTSLNLKHGGYTQIRFKVVAVPDNYPMIKGKAAEAAPEFYTGVKKIISTGDIGIDQAGLRSGRALGVETGGTAPKGYAVWDRVTDSQTVDPTTLKSFGLQAGAKTGAAEKNVINAGGTVIFDPQADAGRRLGKRPQDHLSDAQKEIYNFAKKHRRHVIINPSSTELAFFLSENEIRVLNITGSRLRTANYSNHIHEEELVEGILRRALTENLKAGEKQIADFSHTEDLMRHILNEKWNQSIPFQNAMKKAGQFVHKSEDPFWGEVYPRLLTEVRNEKLLAKEYKLIDEQINGPVDQLNQAEMQSKILSRETAGMFSTSAEGASPLNNYVGLLELTEDSIGLNGMGSRLGAWVDENTLPETMLARVPVTAPNGMQGRFETVVRGIFEGAVQPVIGAMIREPMFTHYFVEGKELTRGIRYFYNHEPNAFGSLRKEVGKASMPKGKNQKKLNVVYKKDESGVIQTLLPDFEDLPFIRSQAEGTLKGNPEAVVVSHLDDYMSGLRSKDMILEDLFKISPWNDANDTRRLLNSSKSETAQEAMETAALIDKHKKLGATADGAFFKAYPEYEELFIGIWKRSKNVDDGRTYKVVTRQLTEYFNLKSLQEEAHNKEALKRALWMTSDFIDDHSVRSLFQEVVGTLLPFWFAEEQFLKRWARTLETRPDALSRLNASLHASQNSGLIYIDEHDRKRMVIPGSRLITEIANLPSYVLGFFGVDAFGVLHGDLSMTLENMIPGYSSDVGMPAAGPLPAIAVQTASLANPELRGDGVFGFEDHLISKFGYGTDAAEIAWSSVVPPPLGKMVAGILGWELPGYAGGRQKANLSIVESAWTLGALPTDKMIADSSNPAKFKQDILDGINHQGRQLQLLQNLTWWGGFTTATPKDMTIGGTVAYNEIFQSYLDTGLPHEIAFEKTTDLYFTQYVDKSRKEGMTDEQILSTWWSSEILKFSVFMTGKYAKSSLARQPSTRAALAWMEDNQSVLEAFPLAGTFFIPAGETEEDREGSSEAKRLQIAMGLKVLKTGEEWLEDLYINAASYVYYGKTQMYDEGIAKARAAKDKVLQDAIQDDKDLFKAEFKASHPIFENSLFSQTSKKRREDTVDQFRLIVNNPDLIPEDTPHRQDILVAMGEVVNFDNEHSLLSGRTDGIANDRRNGLKYEYNEWFKVAILNRPWLYPIYYSLFVPMIEESWITKEEAGVYPELTAGVG